MEVRKRYGYFFVTILLLQDIGSASANPLGSLISYFFASPQPSGWDGDQPDIYEEVQQPSTSGDIYSGTLVNEAAPNVDNWEGKYLTEYPPEYRSSYPLYAETADQDDPWARSKEFVKSWRAEKGIDEGYEITEADLARNDNLNTSDLEFQRAINRQAARDAASDGATAEVESPGYKESYQSDTIASTPVRDEQPDYQSDQVPIKFDLPRAADRPGDEFTFESHGNQFLFKKTDDGGAIIEWEPPGYKEAMRQHLMANNKALPDDVGRPEETLQSGEGYAPDGQPDYRDNKVIVDKYAADDEFAPINTEAPTLGTTAESAGMDARRYMGYTATKYDTEAPWREPSGYGGTSQLDAAPGTSQLEEAQQSYGEAGSMVVGSSQLDQDAVAVDNAVPKTEVAMLATGALATQDLGLAGQFTTLCNTALGYFDAAATEGSRVAMELTNAAMDNPGFVGIMATALVTVGIAYYKRHAIMSFMKDSVKTVSSWIKGAVFNINRTVSDFVAGLVTMVRTTAASLGHCVLSMTNLEASIVDWILNKISLNDYMGYMLQAVSLNMIGATNTLLNLFGQIVSPEQIEEVTVLEGKEVTPVDFDPNTPPEYRSTTSTVHGASMGHSVNERVKLVVEEKIEMRPPLKESQSLAELIIRPSMPTKTIKTLLERALRDNEEDFMLYVKELTINKPLTLQAQMLFIFAERGWTDTRFLTLYLQDVDNVNGLFLQFYIAMVHAYFPRNPRTHRVTDQQVLREIAEEKFRKYVQSISGGPGEKAKLHHQPQLHMNLMDIYLKEGRCLLKDSPQHATCTQAMRHFYELVGTHWTSIGAAKTPRLALIGKKKPVVTKKAIKYLQTLAVDPAILMVGILRLEPIPSIMRGFSCNGNMACDIVIKAYAERKERKILNPCGSSIKSRDVNEPKVLAEFPENWLEKYEKAHNKTQEELLAALIYYRTDIHPDDLELSGSYGGSFADGFNTAIAKYCEERGRQVSVQVV
jgi:hypothetical protein